MANLSKLTQDELKHDLWYRYGNSIELIELQNEDYDMLSKYRFRYTGRIPNKYKKEFTATIPEVLYRNNYWINSEYRMSVLYSELDEEEMKKYERNKDKYIRVKTQDCRIVPFKPDFIKKDNDKEFLHYFDMSFFIGKTDCELQPTEYMGQILSYFEDSKDETLTYYVDECYNTLDYN